MHHIRPMIIIKSLLQKKDYQHSHRGYLKERTEVVHTRASPEIAKIRQTFESHGTLSHLVIGNLKKYQLSCTKWIKKFEGNYSNHGTKKAKSGSIRA